MVKGKLSSQKFSATLYRTQNSVLKGKSISNPRNPLISRQPALKYQMAGIKLRKRKKKRKLIRVAAVIIVKKRLHLKHHTKIIIRAHSVKCAHLASYPIKESTMSMYRGKQIVMLEQSQYSRMNSGAVCLVNLLEPRLTSRK